MKFLKKHAHVLVMVLFAALFILAVPTQVDAATEYRSGYWTYSLSDYTATITNYGANETDVVIPETVTYQGDVYKVTALESNLFEDKSLKTVVIPQYVTSIGNNAFRDCRNLSKVTINAKNLNNCHSRSNDSYYDQDYSVFYNAGTDSSGISVIFGEGVTRIPDYLFCTAEDKSKNIYPHVTNVVISNSVNYIGQHAFDACYDLKTVSWGSGIQTIGVGAFSWCYALESVTIPYSTTSIGDCAFKNCTSLSSITINARNSNNCHERSSDSYYDQDYSVFYNAGADSSSLKVTFGSTVKEIPAYLFCTVADYNYGDGDYAHITSVVIPDSVTSIGKWAFANCYDLKKVSWGNSIQTIGEVAFAGCSFETVTIPSTTTSIGDRAFKNCTSLSSITINARNLNDCNSYSSSSYSYGSYSVFYNAGADSSSLKVTFGSTVKEIPAYLFCTAGDYNYGDGNYAHITYMVIPKSVEVIGKYALYNCFDLTDILYEGRPEDLYEVSVGEGNECENATPHFPVYIKIQPSNSCAKIGETAVVKFRAEGEGLKYTWYFKDKGQTKYNKSSVTGATYTTKMSSKNKDRLVYCVVKDKFGYSVKTKAVALRTPVTISTQPKTTYTKSGSTAKVTVKASGDGLKYTWYYKNKGESKFTKSSLTSSSYSAKMSSKTKDRQVYCVVKDKYGNSVQSKTVTLRMAASITTQPKTTYTKSGSTAKVTVKAAGDGLTYTWYVKSKGASKYTKSSVKTSSYSVTMKSEVKDRQLYCVVKDKYGKTVKSNVVTLRMAASITTQPKSVTVANGKTAKVTVKAAGDGLKYTWYFKDSGKKTFSKSSAKTATYSAKMTSKTKNRQVYCVVKDKYGKTVKSNTVTLKMK